MMERFAVTAFPRPTRRQFAIAGAALLAAGAAPRGARADHASVGGRVLVAEAASAVARGRAKGLPGALVSNGVDVVRTDADGAYRIAIAAGDDLFVIKPAGYAVALDAVTMLPQHYCAAAPHRAADFILTPSGARSSFEAVLIADPQPESHRHLDYIRDGAVPLLARRPVAFGMTLGDIVGDDLRLLGRYNAIMGQAGFPWWNVGGNHDLDLAAPDHFSARAPFRAAYGPATYAFEEGGATFVVLDNVDYQGASATQSHGRYRGRIGARQLRFLRNLLAHTPPERLLILCMHIPLSTDWNPASPSDNTEDWAALLTLLAGRRAVSFAGHMHAAEHQYLALQAGDVRIEHHHHILAALSGSWWSEPLDAHGRPVALGVDGAPPGFHMLSVDGAEYATSFIPFAQPHQRMRALLARCRPCQTSGALVIDGPARADDLPCELVVNLFDGGPRSRLRYRTPGGEWRAMRRERRADPFVIDHFARAQGKRHDWVRPEPCEHLWTAPINASGSGLRRIEIEARDEFGRHLSDCVVLEIA